MLCAGIGSIGVAGNSVLTYSPEATELGFWRSIMPFGSEQKQHPIPQAFYEFDQALTAFSALHHAAKISPSDRRQLLELRDEVIDIELEALLSRDYPLLDQSILGTKTLSFSGDWTATDTYQLNLGSLNSPDSPNKLGRLSADFTLGKGSLSKDSAILTSLLSIDMGTLLFDEMLESWEVFHRELERHTDVRLQADTAWFSMMVSNNGEFDERDQLILDKAHESAPTVLALINQLVTINNIVDPPVEKFGNKMTRINLRQIIKLEVLKRDYPEAYDQYGPLFEHLSFSTRVVTKQGEEIAIIHYDSETKEFGFNMTVSEGGIVLTDREGELTSQIIYPTKLKALDYSVKNDIFVDIYGLKIFIDQLTMKSQYWRVKSAYSAQAEVTMALNELPKIRVEGALLHFVPPWLIDVLIPGTIESAIAGAFSEAVNGRSGEGFVMAFRFNEDKGVHRLSAGMSVELRYELLKDLMYGIDVDDNQQVSNKDEQPLIFKDLGESVRKDFDALLLSHDMRTIGMNW